MNPQEEETFKKLKRQKDREYMKKYRDKTRKRKYTPRRIRKETDNIREINNTNKLVSPKGWCSIRAELRGSAV